MKKFITLLPLIVAFQLTAQSDCVCCTTQYSQFDFWVGSWNVYDTTGKRVGENTITKSEANCLLTEQWRGSQGSTGNSMNFYDRTDSSWHQLWVDDKGRVLRLKGNPSGNAMILKGELIKGRRVDYYYNQISWTQNKDGSVTQRWEIFDDKNNLLSTRFVGVYRKK